MSTRLKAAWHELRCRECRVTWRSWWQRLRGDPQGFDPFGLALRLDSEMVVLNAVDEALNELDAVAHAPVQGEAMHKVIAEHVLHDLRRNSYVVVRKEADGDG